MLKGFNACVVDTDGIIKEVVPDDSKKFSIKELKFYTGAEHLEEMRTHNDYIIVCNRDARHLIGARRNVTASLLYFYSDYDQVYGKVLIAKRYLL